MMKLAAGWTP